MQTKVLPAIADEPETCTREADYDA